MINNVFKRLVVTVLAWFALAMAVAAANPEACRSTLGTLIETADHPDLRWSDFSRLRDPVRQLYERNVYQPVWLAGDRPTRQALAVMEALEQVAALNDAMSAEPLDLEAMEAVFRWFEAELPARSGEVLSAILYAEPLAEWAGDEVLLVFRRRFA